MTADEPVRVHCNMGGLCWMCLGMFMAKAGCADCRDCAASNPLCPRRWGRSMSWCRPPISIAEGIPIPLTGLFRRAP